MESSEVVHFLLHLKRVVAKPDSLEFYEATHPMRITTLLSDELTRYLDLSSLELKLTAQNYVSQQRVTLDDSINRLTAASNYNTGESTQLQSAQDNLLQTNTAQVASQLSSAETQQAALTQVIAAVDQQGTLFNQLQ
jgi:hypothetical protein